MASSRSKKNEKSKLIIVAIMHKCVGKGDLGYLVSKWDIINLAVFLMKLAVNN